jgi:alpha-amylase
MKQSLLLILILVSTSTFAKKVKFAVDMTGQVVNVTGIHCAGDFQTLAGFPGGDWASNTTTLTQEGSTNIYSIVVDIPAFAKYEYKFVNGDQFYEAEFVPEPSRVGYNFNDNRWLWVDSLADDTTFIGALLFGGNAPAGLTLLRTFVDMSAAGIVSTAGIHLAGSFQGWNPATTMMYSFGANVYEIISYVATGTYEYKFYNGNTIADAEVIPGICSVNSSRSVQVMGDTLLSVVCFAACTACPQYISESINDKFTLYPNPCTDVSYLQFLSNVENRNVIITDASGRLVRNYNGLSGNRITIERGNLDRGIYIIRITGEGRVTASGKLIIE